MNKPIRYAIALAYITGGTLVALGLISLVVSLMGSMGSGQIIGSLSSLTSGLTMIMATVAASSLIEIKGQLMKSHYETINAIEKAGK
jgi:hypothetical protein